MHRTPSLSFRKTINWGPKRCWQSYRSHWSKKIICGLCCSTSTLVSGITLSLKNDAIPNDRYRRSRVCSWKWPGWEASKAGAQRIHLNVGPWHYWRCTLPSFHIFSSVASLRSLFGNRLMRWIGRQSMDSYWRLYHTAFPWMESWRSPGVSLKAEQSYPLRLVFNPGVLWPVP